MPNGAVAAKLSSSTASVAVGTDAGVTPSVACGLGRAPVSAKGWVLAMLARKGELRVAPVPRERAFLSGRLCPAKETAPEGVTPAQRRQDLPGRTRGSRP